MKIGVARSPIERLAQLQTGNPDRLRLAWNMPIAGDAYAVEAEAHVMLDRHRVGGEWFAVPSDVAVAAVSGAAFRLASLQPSASATSRGRLSWPMRWAMAVVVPLGFWTLATGPTPAGGCLFLIVGCATLLWRARYVPEIRPRPLLTRVFFVFAVPGLFLLTAWPGSALARWLGYQGSP